MGVPGNPAPAELAATELFAVDAYRTEFDATVTEVDREAGRVRLVRTAFYPVGGGQPCDLGTLTTPGTACSPSPAYAVSAGRSGTRSRAATSRRWPRRCTGRSTGTAGTG